MKNKAMFPPSEDMLNEFTDIVMARCIAFTDTLVQLRDGQWRTVRFRRATDDEDALFESQDFGWWYLNGRSPTSSDYDMVEIK
jgi:hypothetical protein